MQKQKITRFLLILLSAALLIPAGCQKDEQDDQLVVGMELAYPPFETTDSANQPAGISVDFAKALAESIGAELVIENMAWTGLIPSLETGKIDLIISSMTITEDRRQRIDFSDPYAQASLALLINQDSPVMSYADLDHPDRVIAVKRGSTGHIYAENNLKQAQIMVFEKESACVLEVVQGKADAFTYDQLTILKNWEQYRDETRVNLESYQESPEYWGIGIKKGQTKLLEDVNAFIAEYRADGGFDQLAETWLPEQKQIFDEQNIPFFFDVAAP